MENPGYFIFNGSHGYINCKKMISNIYIPRKTMKLLYEGASFKLSDYDKWVKINISELDEKEGLIVTNKNITLNFEKRTEFQIIKSKNPDNFKLLELALQGLNKLIAKTCEIKRKRADIFQKEALRIDGIDMKIETPNLEEIYWNIDYSDFAYIYTGIIPSIFELWYSENNIKEFISSKGLKITFQTSDGLLSMKIDEYELFSGCNRFAEIKLEYDILEKLSVKKFTLRQVFESLKEFCEELDENFKKNGLKTIE